MGIHLWEGGYTGIHLWEKGDTPLGEGIHLKEGGYTSRQGIHISGKGYTSRNRECTSGKWDTPPGGGYTGVTPLERGGIYTSEKYRGYT